MRKHEADNQNSLRAFPFTDDSSFVDAREGRAAMPLDLITSLRVTSAVTPEAALEGTRVIRVILTEDRSLVVLEGAPVFELDGLPEPGRPYPVQMRATAWSPERVCGHIVFGAGVTEGDWAPLNARLLPANYLYIPGSGFSLSVAGDITARYVEDARILLPASVGTNVILPAGYGILPGGEAGYIRTPAILLESESAPQPECSAADPADCKGAILQVNGVPVPEDGNVELDSVDLSGDLGDSVPGDSIPGPMDFSTYPEPGDSLPADPAEPPTILIDMPHTVPALCGQELGNPQEARLPVAMRAYATLSEVAVHIAVVNDSLFSAVPCFSLTVMADVGTEAGVLAPATWSLKTAPPRGSAVEVGGWGTGNVPYAYVRGDVTPGSVTDPVRYQNLNPVAPPYPSGIPGAGTNVFSPIGWVSETPWKSIPAVIALREDQGVAPPAFEALAPGEILTVTYLLTTAALGDGERLTITATAAAHLLTPTGEVAGSSRGAISKFITIGGSPTFSKDDGPGVIESALLPEYTA